MFTKENKRAQVRELVIKIEKPERTTVLSWSSQVRNGVKREGNVRVRHVMKNACNRGRERGRANSPWLKLRTWDTTGRLLAFWFSIGNGHLQIPYSIEQEIGLESRSESTD